MKLVEITKTKKDHYRVTWNSPKEVELERSELREIIGEIDNCI